MHELKSPRKIKLSHVDAAFSIRELLRVLLKVRIKIVARGIYSYLFFFLYMHPPLLLENKKFL